jgi:acyl dehydratase
MTFQDAIEFKRKLGKDQVSQDDLTMKVFVTPADHDDFARYVTDYRGGHFTDETSKKYSLNGQFKVHGLWTNGADVLYKDLTK